MGRPRNFDVDKALLAAINVFWEKGYDGASMKDLTEEMGINSPSLYSVFGDKKSLYIQAIKRYVASDTCPPLDAFNEEEDITKAVRAFLETSLEHATQQSIGRKGCFMSNCVSTTTASVEESQVLLLEAIVLADKKIAQRFDKEKAKGALPETFPSFERAKLMFDLRQGYVLRARAGIRKDEMERDLDYRVSIILSL
ncbi:TetR/AcrR family transcriptional regulator [Candidatus Albibeggiatoa sp. nov. NOAA]|uniref:TetR/AcrR family transcriptional regulator n=1 Tax=Candidatus Albibeggiatoa sp. nov. NOAA TaxID=3162724 RepID=UPI0033030149|nr:TetR/AcrR family transcriptional regulator [Thiotrichaceae bacterium]